VPQRSRPPATSGLRELSTAPQRLAVGERQPAEARTCTRRTGSRRLQCPTPSRNSSLGTFGHTNASPFALLGCGPPRSLETRLALRLVVAVKIEGDYHGLVLHEVAPPIIEHGIAAFLRSRFAEIRDDHNALYGGSKQELQLGWPGPKVVHTLVQMAMPLFIFAATMCRFMQDSGCDPSQQLAQVLQYQSRIHQSEIDKLDATYRPSVACGF